MVTIDLEKYKAILFDFDGTLVDSEPLHYESYRIVLKRLGIKYGPLKYHYEKYLGSGKNIIIQELDKHDLLGSYSIDQLNEEKKQVFNELLEKKSIKAIKGASDFLEQLEFTDLQLAVVSGGIRESILLAIDRVGLPNSFTKILTESDFHKSKPDPAGYLMAAKLLRVKPSECLVFEDAPNGVLSARAAGMDCIGLLTYVNESRLQEVYPGIETVAHFEDIIIE